MEYGSCVLITAGWILKPTMRSVFGEQLHYPDAPYLTASCKKRIYPTSRHHVLAFVCSLQCLTTPTNLHRQALPRNHRRPWRCRSASAQFGQRSEERALGPANERHSYNWVTCALCPQSDRVAFDPFTNWPSTLRTPYEHATPYANSDEYGAEA